MRTVLGSLLVVKHMIILLGRIAFQFDQRGVFFYFDTEQGYLLCHWYDVERLQRFLECAQAEDIFNSRTQYLKRKQ